MSTPTILIENLGKRYWLGHRSRNVTRPCVAAAGEVHVTRHFYDEIYHVPVLFSGAGTKSHDIRGLASSMDVGPTLLGLLGIDKPASFAGSDLSGADDSARDHVVMEHMGSGHGDFRAKTILMCIRSRMDKIVYVQPPPREGKIGYVREYYCLKDDPCEQINRASEVTLSAEARRLVDLARQRLTHLYEENGLGALPA